jgi:hypothetical protein
MFAPMEPIRIEQMFAGVPGPAPMKHPEQLKK